MVGQVRFVTYCREAEPWVISEKVVERTTRLRGFCERFKEAGLWMLPESRGHSMIGYLSDSCLRGRKTRVRLKL